MLKKSVTAKGVDESEHDGSLDEESGSNGCDEENMGTPGKMFVNQHLIKICFKEESSNQLLGSPVKDDPKIKKVTPKKAIAGKTLKSKKSPRGKDDSIANGGAADGDVISLKYTIDYPRVELHPFDTRKFTIYYADTKVNAKYDCNRCIEMRASSRQSRDIIALLIRCFSAQTYYINSKIIANVADDSESNVDEDADLGPKIYSVSDVLLELEQVKRELYN